MVLKVLRHPLRSSLVAKGKLVLAAIEINHLHDLLTASLQGLRLSFHMTSG